MVISVLSIVISIFFSYLLNLEIENMRMAILIFVLFLIPSSEIVIQILQYVLSKIVKPKLIPKIDFSNGIDKENSSMVVIPTILKNKEKVQEMMENLERYYLANKSENLYFILLGDCSQSGVQNEKFDEEVIRRGNKTGRKIEQKISK